MSNFISELASALNLRKQDHLYRQRLVVDESTAAKLKIDGKSYVNFCSNDYLGLASDAKLKLALQQATEKYGVGSGASQLVCGYSQSHQQLELELADFLQRPRAVVFSSGFLANLGVISSLLSRNDSAYLDRLDHASIIDGVKFSGAKFERYAHKNVEDLERRLKKPNSGKSLVISDGVFSMDGDIAPVAQLTQLTKQHDALLMIDDAHGVGVLGKNARGCIELANTETQKVDILVGTFGKAFGTCGAFVSGKEEIIETIIQKSRTLIYTTALPAAITETTRASLKLIRTESWRRDKLNSNIEYFKRQSERNGINLSGSSTAIQPIIVGSSEASLALSEALKHAGLLVIAIRPPTVAKNGARLRITLSAAHDQNQIDLLVSTLSAQLTSLGLATKHD